MIKPVNYVYKKMSEKLLLTKVALFQLPYYFILIQLLPLKVTG